MAAGHITAARLRELLTYDPETGAFTNRVKRSRKVVPGEPAGGLRCGYVAIRLDGRLYQAHRLAWLYMTGAWPAADVDHINGDRADNRWVNLRDVPHQANMQNQRRPRSDNKTGFLGVHRIGDRFGAQIKGPRGWLGLGYFATPEEAHAAYLKAKRELHEGCTI